MIRAARLTGHLGRPLLPNAERRKADIPTDEKTSGRPSPHKKKNGVCLRSLSVLKHTPYVCLPEREGPVPFRAKRSRKNIPQHFHDTPVLSIYLSLQFFSIKNNGETITAP